MIFAFTDRDIGNLLAKKKRDGLTVEGVFDQCQIDRFSEFRWLGKQGVKEWMDGNQALLHHKVMVIDDRVVCCGSYNFTKSAEQHNNEVSAIIRSSRLAADYRAEFDRLVYAAEHNPPLPPYDHPACQHEHEANQPVPR
jgi:phosphatidylserine/phosphatidylglycerophosphate/cardiolipin synthase-like enzyme